MMPQQIIRFIEANRQIPTIDTIARTHRAS